METNRKSIVKLTWKVVFESNSVNWYCHLSQRDVFKIRFSSVSIIVVFMCLQMIGFLQNDSILSSDVTKLVKIRICRMRI